MFYNLFLIKVHNIGKLGEEEIEYELQSDIFSFTKKQHDDRNNAVLASSNPIFGCSFNDALKMFEVEEFHNILVMFAMRCHHGENRGVLKAYLVPSSFKLDSETIRSMLKNKDKKLLLIMNENDITNQLAKLIKHQRH